MTITALLKRITFAENILGVYRNYLDFSKRKRLLIIFRVVTEIILTILYFGFRISEGWNRSFISEDRIIYNTDLCLCLTLHIFALASVLFNARYFQAYYKHLAIIQKCLKNGMLQDTDGNIKKRFFRVSFASFSFFFVAVFFGGGPNITRHTSRQFLYIVIGLLLETRMLLQNIQTIGSLAIISGYLQCIANSVQESQTSLKINSLKEQEDYSEAMSKRFYYALDNKMKTWATVYENLHGMNYYLEKTFGLQVFVTICYGVIFLTLLAFKFATNFLKETGFFTSEWTLIFMAMNFVEMSVNAWEGQKLQTEAARLKCNLATLHLALIDAPSAPLALVKSVGHFWKSSSAEGLVIKLPFSFRLGMPMLLAYLAITTEYVMIGLQASHVV